MSTLPTSSSPPPGPDHPVGKDLREDFLGTLTRGQRTYGDLVRYKVGPVSLYAISHPDLAQQTLVEGKRIFTKIGGKDKPSGLQLVLGFGLLTNVNPDSWLSQRRMMQPIFHRQRLTHMADKMVDAGERMITRWRALPPGSVVDASHEMMRTTLEIVNRTMFTAEVINDDGVADDIGNDVKIAARFAFGRAFNPIQWPLWWPNQQNREFKQAVGRIDAMLYGIINQRRTSGEKPGDLLDMLLEARDEDTGKGMTNKQLRDEVITIFGAGHETTANALTWTLYLLSQHPEIRAQCHAEVDTVLGGRPPALADLEQLPYTLQVLEESLRLFPPAPIIPRTVAEDAELGGYHLPKGGIAIISVYNLHHHPDFWPDPEQFNPDRFAPNQRDGRHRYAYIPFGAGPRLCIGNSFALMEGQLLLTMMIQNFKLCLVEGHPVEKEVAITMRPRYGMKMTLHPHAMTDLP